MFITKEYYSILGVLPNTGNIFIETAYKALVKIYDLDDFTGPKEEAHRKLKEINEAYSVLSDPDKKKKYDESYGSAEQKESFYFKDKNKDQIPPYNPLKVDWDLAVEHHPDLTELENKLAQISWRLGYSYRAYIIETGLFTERIRLAHDLEQDFLKIYFGPKPEMMNFAHSLLKTGNKPATRALNRSLRSFGKATKNDKIINQIRFEYNIPGTEKEYFNILKNLGYKIIFKKEGLFKLNYIWEVTFPDSSKIKIQTIKELGAFTREKQLEENQSFQVKTLMRKIENSYQSKLNKIGYKLHSRKDGWIVTDANNEKIRFTALEDLGSFLKEKLLDEVNRLQNISAKQKLENSYEYKLKQIGYTIHPRKDGWVLTDANNRKIKINSLEVINDFVFVVKRRMLCESVLDKKGFILVEKRSKWVINNYLGNKKVFKTLEDLEVYTKDIANHV